MAESYSSSLQSTLIGTGDLSGTWGSVTNTNLGTLLEQAIAGYVVQVYTTDADVTLTIANGVDGNGNTSSTIYTPGSTTVPVSARNMYIECQTSSITTTRHLYLPLNKKLYLIYNNNNLPGTGTGQSIIVAPVSGGGSSVTVPAGQRAFVTCDGTNIVLAQSLLGPINGVTIGATVPSTGVFTTLTAASTTLGPGPTIISSSSGLISITGGSTVGQINQVAIGQSTPAAGAFTTLSASLATTLGSTLGVSGAATHSSTTSLGGLTTYNADALGTYIEVGFRDIPLSPNSNPVIADRGKFLYVTSNVTVPASTFSAGNAITIVNNSATSITVTFTSGTVYLAGTATTGVTRTVAQRGMLTALCTAANTWFVSGAGVT